MRLCRCGLSSMRAALSGVTKYESTGGGAEKQNNDADADGALVFIPRQVPLTPATRGGFVVFIVFLVSFSFIVMQERNDSVFWFAEHARQLVGVDDFRRLAKERHSYREYQQWFTYHFLDGMANATTRRMPGQSVTMLGPPRMRQVRYADNCRTPSYMSGLVPACLNNYEESQEPFGVNVREGLTNTGGQWNYVTAEATGDTAHYGRLHYKYSGAGYLLEMKPLLERPANLLDPGSEFYPFAHWKVNVTDLWEAGWIDKYTKAIFHDFTLYSSSEDLYANVRVIAEFESNAGVFHMGLNLRVFWLERSTSWMLVQYTFAVFLFILILGELDELRWGMRIAEKVLVERVVELKYLLRLKELQFGAEHGLPALYKPRKVLKKLSYRLYQADSSCVHHIRQLNAIGQKIPPLDSHFQDATRMLRAAGMKGSAARFKPNSVVTDNLNLAKAQLNTLRAADESDNLLKKLHRLRIRWSAAVRFYYQTDWNNLDSLNYFLLFSSFCCRVYSWSLMDEHRELVAKLDRVDPFADENYINMFTVALYFGLSFYINSLSAILTWIKLFKYLSFFPQMSIFTRTLTLSASHLAVFFLVVVVVLIGSAQGFCLAFGADVDGFRDPFVSVMTMSLFTVGRFDYDQLIWSQRWLGPILFWIYIFLVFFVMMSVFIAILSEGYEAAKTAIPATSSGNIWEAVQTVAVTNYIDVRESTRMALRRVTGKNNPKDKLVGSIHKVRAGIQVAGVISSFREREEHHHIGANDSGKSRMVSNKEAHIATDSESDEEPDVVFRRLGKRAALLMSGGGPADNIAMVDSIRAQIVDIYSVHNPDKIELVDELLAEWRGEEEALLANIKKKYQPVANVNQHENRAEGETATTQNSLPGTPAEEPSGDDAKKQGKRKKKDDDLNITPARRRVKWSEEEEGRDNRADGKVLKRLSKLEEAVEALVAEGEHSAAQLQGLQEKIAAVSTESGDTLQQIVEHLSALVEASAPSSSSHGRHRSPDASAASADPSHRHKHGTAPREHRHHREAGDSVRQRGHVAHVRATSPSPTHGSAVRRERPSPQPGTPQGLAGVRASSNGRSSVPNMRQQLAAMTLMQGGSAAAQEKRKVPSMREQMAQMSASNNVERSP